MADFSSGANQPWAMRDIRGRFLPRGSADDFIARQQSIAVANVAVNKLDAKLDRTAKKVKEVRIEAAAVNAEVSGAVSGQSLMQRLKAKMGIGFGRGAFQAGPVEIGKGGVRMNAGFIRGAAGGAFVVGVAGQAAGGAINTYVDTTEKLRELQAKGATGGEQARSVALGVAGAVRGTLAGLTGVDAITRGILRLRGLTDSDAQNMMDQYYRNQSSTEEDVKRRLMASEAIRIAAYQEIERNYRKTEALIHSELPTTFRLQGKSDVETYHREMKNLNADLLEYNKNRELRKADEQRDTRDNGGH